MVSVRRRRREPQHIGAQTHDIQVPIYIHQDRITASLDDGVEVATVRVIVAYSPRNHIFNLDCVDMEEFNTLLPKTSRQHLAGGLVPVITATMEALLERGIGPTQVRGWGRWFSSNDIQRARREVGC